MSEYLKNLDYSGDSLEGFIKKEIEETNQRRQVPSESLLTKEKINEIFSDIAEKLIKDTLDKYSGTEDEKELIAQNIINTINFGWERGCQEPSLYTKLENRLGEGKFWQAKLWGFFIGCLSQKGMRGSQEAMKKIKRSYYGDIFEERRSRDIYCGFVSFIPLANKIREIFSENKDEESLKILDDNWKELDLFWSEGKRSYSNPLEEINKNFQENKWVIIRKRADKIENNLLWYGAKQLLNKESPSNPLKIIDLKDGTVIASTSLNQTIASQFRKGLEGELADRFFKDEGFLICQKEVEIKTVLSNEEGRKINLQRKGWKQINQGMNAKELIFVKEEEKGFDI